jgi:hypothetical protein
MKPYRLLIAIDVSKMDLIAAEKYYYSIRKDMAANAPFNWAIKLSIVEDEVDI